MNTLHPREPRARHATPRTVSTRQLLALRARLNALLGLALAGDADERRACGEHLQAAIDEWNTELTGRATPATLTDLQLQALLRKSPRHKMLVAAAREGCARAQDACAQLLNDE